MKQITNPQESLQKAIAFCEQDSKNKKFLEEFETHKEAIGYLIDNGKSYKKVTQFLKSIGVKTSEHLLRKYCREHGLLSVHASTSKPKPKAVTIAESNKKSPDNESPTIKDDITLEEVQ
ncbi:hypothetical protein Dacet_0661 [Denitrovibrio acetiphilus DSM 12809]|uniref:Uncharacterized protein n=1 Tax=Denitrovibrio acetiphilus (strain DSM 12809 / NBRC 114555 / N2460) TaxID=522772 RepID=D4H4Q5_DENA2|nr:hypothetical protein [Denitrovibrio acetiphilus]ADD67449.1 hypothetical protein Dacet_0661 [Denitrovibrio acetiphilus DSM 12809]